MQKSSNRENMYGSQSSMKGEQGSLGFQVFAQSLSEFKQLRNVVFCGLMAALAVILGYVATFNIGPYIRIGISSFPNRMVEYLFGPVMGVIFGGVLDILKFIVRPTGAFFPGFTLNAMLAGLVYGFFLYKKPVKIWRILCAEVLVKAVLNCVLNTLWLSILYGEAFSILLEGRILKNIIMLPVDSLILYALLLVMDKNVRPFIMERGVRKDE